jgi:1-acyl-sn-glycerol-3-phosphate acyltransferase
VSTKSSPPPPPDSPARKRRRRRRRRAALGEPRGPAPGSAAPAGGATGEARQTLPSPGTTREAASAWRAPPEPPGPVSEAPRDEPSSAPPRDDPSSARLRALEERLGRLTRAETTRDEEAPPASIREQVTVVAREVVDRLAAPVARVDETNVVDSVRELLSSDYYLRQWGRLGMRHRSEEVDEFGLDPVYEKRLLPFVDFLYKTYFRVDTEGVENIPETGRCLVVANHSGTLPLDGLMLRACVRLAQPAARPLRWLAEDYVYYLPFVGAFMSRVGAVRACQENAERLLANDNLVAVFPEGVKGIGKLYRDRYRLQRFGRGGFIRLCLRTGTPLVPCAVVGAEEASPMLHRDEAISRLMGLPYLPVTPTFPLLGPLGLVPAPTKWRIRFGEIIRFDGYGPEAAEDPVLVGRLADRVRAGIQQMLDHSLAERKSVWFG